MRQFALYGLNGVINTLVSYCVFFVFAQVIDYRAAIVIGYLVGMATSYSLNSRVVFLAKGRPVRFVAVNLSMMTLNVATTWALVARTGLAEEVAQLIAIAFVFVIGFVLNRLFVFNVRSAVVRGQDNA